jgi:D-lyxose ketol-isomerase
MSADAVDAAYTDSEKGEVLVAIDGNEERFPGFRRIEAGLSEQSVTLLRFKDYEFWATVKQKLLSP